MVLDAWLERDGAVVQNRDVLSQIGFFADLIEPDSTKQMLELKPTGKEGLFAIELPFRKAGGAYPSAAFGGKTFNRTREFRVAVWLSRRRRICRPQPPKNRRQHLRRVR